MPGLVLEMLTVQILEFDKYSCFFLKKAWSILNISGETFPLLNMKFHQNGCFKETVDFVEFFLAMKKGFLPYYVKFISRCN